MRGRGGQAGGEQGRWREGGVVEEEEAAFWEGGDVEVMGCVWVL